MRAPSRVGRGVVAALFTVCASSAYAQDEGAPEWDEAPTWEADAQVEAQDQGEGRDDTTRRPSDEVAGDVLAEEDEAPMEEELLAEEELEEELLEEELLEQLEQEDEAQLAAAEGVPIAPGTAVVVPWDPALVDDTGVATESQDGGGEQGDPPPLGGALPDALVAEGAPTPYGAPPATGDALAPPSPMPYDAQEPGPSMIYDGIAPAPAPNVGPPLPTAPSPMVPAPVLPPPPIAPACSTPARSSDPGSLRSRRDPALRSGLEVRRLGSCMGRPSSRFGPTRLELPSPKHLRRAAGRKADAFRRGGDGSGDEPSS